MNDQHPDQKKIQQWVSNSLPPEEMSRLDAHLESCHLCSRLLEQTLKADKQPFARQLSQMLAPPPKPDSNLPNSQPKPSLKTSSPIPPPREKNDAFEIIDIYDSGGIGKIWRAYERGLNRIVAVKKLRREIAGNVGLQQRFLREARITGQLSHPGIVPVYRIVDQGKNSGYSMPLLNGTSFTKKIEEYHRDRLQNEDRFSDFLRLLESFVAVCNTIAYSHSKDVIHRDLKSDNIMLGEFGEVTVLDWGLAKRLEDEPDDFEGVEYGNLSGSTLSTLAGQRLGTPSFMSPEQAQGKLELVGKSSDIYGLAGILYEVLTGHPPFVKKDLEATMAAVISDPVTPPKEHNPNAPLELETICLKGLEKDTQRRPKSAKVLGKAVQNWLANTAEQKRNEQERQRFFALSVDMMAILDSDQKVCEANDAWLSTLCYERNQLVDHALDDYIHQDDLEKFREVIVETKKGNTQSDFELRIQNSQGQYRWTQWNATPIIEDGQIYLIGRDITERKINQQMFSQLFDSAPDAMIVAKPDSTIFMVNSQAEKLFGYDREEMIGASLESLMPNRFRKNHQTKVDSFFGDPTFRPMAEGVNLLACHKDGSEFEVQISLSPVVTDAGVFVTSSIRRGRNSQTKKTTGNKKKTSNKASSSSTPPKAQG